MLYACNRWWWKPQLGLPFLRDHFNDVLLVPCALPVALGVEGLIGTRGRGRPPTSGETAAYALGWSVVCEVVGPALFPWSTPDPWDVVAYMAGALLAASAAGRGAAEMRWVA